MEKGINDDLRHFLAIFQALVGPQGSPMDDLVSHEKLRGTFSLRDDPNTEKMGKKDPNIIKNLKNDFFFIFMLNTGPQT